MSESQTKAAVAEPKWAAELTEPVHVTECVRMHGDGAPLSLLVGSFRRARNAHAAQHRRRRVALRRGRGHHPRRQ